MEIGLSLGLTRGGGGGGRAFYVSSSGSDLADGLTPATAWATIGKANTPGPVVYTARDRVLFQGGQQFAGSIVAHAGVTYDSYGGGRAEILPPAADPGFYAHNVTAKLRNLVFTGAGIATATARGVHFYNNLAGDIKLGGCEAFNVTVRHFGDNGITFEGDAGLSGYSSPTVNGCTVHDCAGPVVTTRTVVNSNSGITFHSSGAYGSDAGCAHLNPRVTLSTVYNCPGKPGHNNWSGSGIMLGQSDGAVIDYCVAYNNGHASDYAGAGPVGIWFADCKNSNIRYCESYANGTNGSPDGGGFDLDGDCRDCVIEYCYSHGNEGAGYLLYSYADAGLEGSQNNTVRYCVSINDGANGQGSIYLNHSFAQSGSRLYGNTVYTSVGSALNISGNQPNTIIANNLFITSGSQFLVNIINNPSGFQIVGNAYWTADGSATLFAWNSTAYGDIQPWRAASGQETLAAADTSRVGNPQLSGLATALVATMGNWNPGLLAGLKPSAGSPMLSGGLDLAALFAEELPSADFFGAALTEWGVGVSGEAAPGAPAWLPAGATDFIDLENSRAYIDGVQYASLAGLYDDSTRACAGALLNRMLDFDYCIVASGTIGPNGGGSFELVQWAVSTPANTPGNEGIDMGLSNPASPYAYFAGFNGSYNPVGTYSQNSAVRFAGQFVDGLNTISTNSSLNGQAVQSDGSASPFTGIAHVTIGGIVGQLNARNGTMRSVALYPPGQSHAALQALSA